LNLQQNAQLQYNALSGFGGASHVFSSRFLPFLLLYVILGAVMVTGVIPGLDDCRGGSLLSPEKEFRLGFVVVKERNDYAGDES